MPPGFIDGLQKIAAILFQLFTFLASPLGGFLLSVLFNILFVIVLIWLIHIFIETLKQKDQKISNLIEDLKILTVKADLTHDEYVKLVTGTFLRPDSEAKQVSTNETDTPSSSPETPPSEQTS